MDWQRVENALECICISFADDLLNIPDAFYVFIDFSICFILVLIFTDHHPAFCNVKI